MTDDAEAPLGRPGSARRRVAYIATGISLCTLGAIANLHALAEAETPAGVSETIADNSEPAEGEADESSSMDPDEAARKAGIVSLLDDESGHFLSSPYGRMYATGNDDADVWGGLTGTEVGQAHGVGGLGVVGTGRGGGGTGEGTSGIGNVGLIGKGGGGGAVPRFRAASSQGRRGSTRSAGGRGLRGAEVPLDIPNEPHSESGFVRTDVEPKSTFSIDVDTASYTRLRESLRRRQIPRPESIRVEEMLNYFDYEDPQPLRRHPFAVTTEVAPCPWNAEHELVRIGIQGEEVEADRPPSNLVFLIDSSGSMGAGGLQLVQHGLSELAGELDHRDRVAIVTYAGSDRVVLDSTHGDKASKIRRAIDSLTAGGGTNGAAGIERAYELAQEGFIKGGVNRVILATDGDFNVGVTSHDALIEMIEAFRKKGVSLSVLGVNAHGADHTMEQLADKGDGNYAFLDSRDEAHRVLVEEMAGTLVSIAKDVKLQLTMNPQRVQSYRLVGYENRRLANRDFADDTKDAGELGSGHTVTALYELVPAADADREVEPLSVELRYKSPGGGPSRLVPKSYVERRPGGDEPSVDFRWAAAVAQFGMMLSMSEHRGDATWYATHELARHALGQDEAGRRCEMLGMVASAANVATHGDLVEFGGDGSCGDKTLVRVDRSKPVRRAPPPEPEVTPPDPPEVPDVDVDLVFVTPATPTLWDYVMGTLRLLPPILALPMFVMAFRRRREDGGHS